MAFAFPGLVGERNCFLKLIILCKQCSKRGQRLRSAADAREMFLQQLTCDNFFPALLNYRDQSENLRRWNALLAEVSYTLRGSFIILRHKLGIRSRNKYFPAFGGIALLKTGVKLLHRCPVFFSLGHSERCVIP